MIVEKIKRGLEKPRKSKGGLADALGVHQSQITRLLSEGRTLKASEIPIVESYLEISLAETQSAPSPVQRPPSDVAPANERPISRSEMPLDVPVLGTAVGGNGGDFRLNGETVDYARRPPGIAMAHSVFALYVRSYSMAPKYEEGELIYINPNRPPMIGDYVVIEMHAHPDGTNGEGYLKRLVKRTATMTIVEQFNPPKTIEFQNSEIKALLRVIPWNELVGV